MNKRTPTLGDLQHDAVRSLTGYLQAEESDKTGLLRDVATAFVQAREHFYTKEGTPDWSGRSYAYRTWVRETVALASVPASKRTTLLAAIRYHSGNVARELLDPETLAAAGLRSESPRERSIEKRERYSETLSIFGGGGHRLTDADEIVGAARTIEAVLRRVDLDAVRELAAADRSEVADATTSVYTLSREIADAANTPS